MSDRVDISDRAAALLASLFLFDLGLISENDTSYIIDKNTVRRERLKYRAHLKPLVVAFSLLHLFFDGRKDLTIKIVKTPDGRWRRRLVKEEHIVLLDEPNSRFLRHITPTSFKTSSSRMT